MAPILQHLFDHSFERLSVKACSELKEVCRILSYAQSCHFLLKGKVSDLLHKDLESNVHWKPGSGLTQHLKRRPVFVNLFDRYHEASSLL